MKLVFVLFFTIVSVCLGQLEAYGIKPPIHLNPVGKSKFASIASKSLNDVFVKSNNNGDTQNCKSLVAYYVGTLKNKKDPTKTYDVEFQLKLWTDEKKQKVHVYLDKWNEEYSKSQDFELDFYYGGNRQWCNIYDDDCDSSFTKKTTNFTLDLNTASGNYFHLLNFQNFNNSFSLLKAKGQCTKHQLVNLNDDYTPDLEDFSYCVCCDEYEPNALLNCPHDKWSVQATTTKAPTTPPLVSHNQTCQKIIAYYVGTFQWPSHPSYTFDAQVQLEFNANLRDKTFYYGFNHWNQSLLNKDEHLGLYIFDTDKKDFCDTQRKNCTLPFVKQPTYRAIGFSKMGAFLTGLLQFPSFNNSFTLNNTIGGCTNYQPYNSSEWHASDPNLYSYCICCDKYNPHPSLNCPPNPWQGL